MEEAEKFCENCKRHVSAANFASHSAFCERNVKVCEICDEPYQVSLEEEHLEECHAVMPCNLCEQPVEKWLLSKHQEVCVKRLIQCEFCDLKLPFDKYREHDDFCGSRTEKCLLCQKYIMLKEKQQHTEFHRHGRKMPKDNSKTKLHRTHAVEASSQLGACKLEETEKSVVRDNPVEPEEQNWVNEVISLSKSCGNSKLLKKDSEDDVFTCPVCKQMMMAINRRSHVCMRESVTTSVNGERGDSGVAASIGDVKEESKHFTTCHVCKERIRWMDYNIHVPTCATVRGRCSVCGERVASGEMKDHMRRCSKNSQKAEHIESMESNLRNSARPTVPLHGACYSESYECPLCSEKIPESDKQKHESFFCKVLLDLDKPDNFSSIANFDFSKASQERSKKVSSELSVTDSTKSSGKFRTEEYPRYFQGNGSYTFMGHTEFKGAMPKYSSKIVIPTSGQCKHCKTLLNDDILSIHEEQCIHQEINCPNCDDGLKLMDADHHTCRWTKVKGKHDKKNGKPKDSDSAGWSWGGFFSRKSQDKNERGRNKSYSEITANRIHQTLEDTSAFQHFPQTCIDDAKIPCEFCGKLFSVHYLIEHETGCRPEEVSFAKPKPENAAKVEERKPDASQRSDRVTQSHVPRGNFFGDSGKPPPSKNKSHKRLQDSSVKPGEFLDINRLKLEDKKNVSQSLVKKPNPSAIFSVWNGDSSDEMYEETPTKEPPSEEAPEKNSCTIENGKSVSDGSEEFYSGSDEEVSEMLHFIHGRQRELSKTTVERESVFLKPKDDASNHLNKYKLGMKQSVEDSPGATAATQPEESPFQKAFDDIIKSRDEFLKSREAFLKSREEFLSQDSTGATAATQPEETPFKEAFDYILKSREEFLSQDKTCWKPSKIHQNEETFYKERENVGINLNENQKVQESFSSAKENDKKMYSPPPLPRWLSSLPSTDGGESDVCRICHGEGDRESLVTPCRCAGTLRYVHQSCLQQWIKSSHIHRCELCHSRFFIRTKTRP